MDDLISRQEAIEALQEHRNLFCDNTPETFSKLSYAEKSRVDELDMAIATLINLPSAQPEKRTDKRTETHSCDCIDQIDREPTIEPRCETCESFNQTRLLIPQPQRKNGHWIRHPEQRNIFNGKTIECSECHEKYTVQYVEDELFCRHCGADMREPEDIPMEYFESGGR